MEREEKIKRHRDFWAKSNRDRPLIGFNVGSYFPTTIYEAAEPLLEKGLKIEPEMVNPEEFLADYSRLRCAHERIEQDTFWTAEPFNGFPWLEAIFGCEIEGSGEGFWAESMDLPMEKIIESEPLKGGNKWMEKYVAFLETLVDHSEGDYPIGQPIFRGPTDLYGTVRGHSEFAVELMQEPDLASRFVGKLTDFILEVGKRTREIMPEFFGGQAIGFYDLWAPGGATWFQEDLSAILSPNLYREFFFEPDERLASAAQYSLLHLHTSSIFLFDHFSSLPSLDVIEINRDVNDKTDLSDLVSRVRETLENDKRIVLLWDCTESESFVKEEVSYVADRLSPEGLYLQFIVNSAEQAENLFPWVRAQYN